MKPRAALVTFGVVVVLSPQLFGGVFGWTVAVLTALMGMAGLAVGAWALARGARRPPVPPLGWVAIAVLAFTAMQATPMPREVVEWLQPSVVQAADDASRLLGEPSRAWLPLSFAPHATRTEVLKGAALLCAFLAAWYLARAGVRRLLLLAVVASTLLMAIVALTHALVGARAVFGVYEPVDTASALLAPLMNPNHLSAFLALGVPVAIGLALSADPRPLRLTYLGAAVLLGVVSLAAISRGGVVSLLCGTLTLGLLGLMRRRGRGRRRDASTALLPIGATAVAVLALGLYVASEALLRDFGGDLSKLELAGEGFGLAVEHPWTGIGRGAFSAVFVADHGRAVRYTHPENWVAQWASEWGLLVSAVLIVAIALASVRALREARSWGRLGALAGVASIAAHDLVDFATEFLGLAMVVAVLMGAALAPSSKQEREEDRPPLALGLPFVIASLSAIALALSLALGSQIEAGNVPSLRATLERQMARGDSASFEDTLRNAVRLHPSEPAFFLLGGAEAGHRGELSALAWLNQAMRRASGWAAPHLEAARVLAARGHLHQSFLEAREAETRQPGIGNRFVCDVLRRRPSSAETLVEAVGADPVGTSLLDAVARCLPLAGDAARRIDTHLVSRGVLGAHLRNARRRLAQDDPAGALEALEPVADRTEAAVLELRGRALLDADRPEETLRLLADVTRQPDAPESLLRLMAEARAEGGDVSGMRETLETLRGRAAGRPQPLAAAWIFQGRLEERAGNDGAAMQAFERAHRLHPGSDGLAQVARLSERLGALSRAYRANAELCRLHGPGHSACTARDRLQRRLSERPLPRLQPSTTP